MFALVSVFLILLSVVVGLFVFIAKELLEDRKITKNKLKNPQVNDYGETIWTNANGWYHRLDGPAFEGPCGKYWYINGKRHREDGPAIIHGNGDKSWYINGTLHRIDGPAAEQANGNKWWYQNNKLHRLDGPAVEYADGSKHWYKNDERHRTDGPAIEWADGSKAWYLNGKKLTEQEFLAKTKKPESTMRLEGENKVWRNEKKQYHRIDGPAFIAEDGFKSWFINGQRHREDGPAIVWANGSEFWYQDGKYHREDGPAIIFTNEVKAKYWYLNGRQLTEKEFLAQTKKPESTMVVDNRWKNEKGQLHRLDGPAVENANGSKEWWINGRRHRADGPAVIDKNGDEFWYINGVRTENKSLISDSTMETDKRWVNAQGQLHRTDGPAIEYTSGDKHWFQNGRLHREDGPSIMCSNGHKEWFLNGERHRTDGPAMEFVDGSKSWWVNGEQLTEQEFLAKTKPESESTMMVNATGDKCWRNFKGQYHRTDGPAVENVDGYKVWYINGKQHRDDGPAIEYPNGTKHWYKYGERHREDGPAIEYHDGRKIWYINGEQLTEQEFLAKTNKAITVS